MFFDEDDEFNEIEERLVQSTKGELDAEENVLRPKTLEGYVGQTKVKDNLKVFMQAALSRGEALEHVLLYGAPGLGKTTLAHIIANEMHGQIKITSAPAITRGGDLASMLSNLNDGDVFFIDEIHRLPMTVEETLYSAMEDFAIDVMLGKGPGARSMRLPLHKFTLIGATTRAGMISNPMRDRFGIICRLEMYTTQDLTEIVMRSAKTLGIQIEEDAAKEIAMRSRGTPRICNRLLKRVRDFSTVNGNSTVNIADTKYALKRMEIDELGLDEVDRNLLKAMIEKFDGKPVGLDTLAVTVNEDPGTIEDAYEPYLLQLGFIARTPRGRIILRKGYEHLGYTITDKQAEQLSLFNKKDE